MGRTRSCLERNSSADQKWRTKHMGRGYDSGSSGWEQKIGSRGRTGRKKGDIWCEEAGGNC